MSLELILDFEDFTCFTDSAVEQVVKNYHINRKSTLTEVASELQLTFVNKKDPEEFTTEDNPYGVNEYSPEPLFREYIKACNARMEYLEKHSAYPTYTEEEFRGFLANEYPLSSRAMDYLVDECYSEYSTAIDMKAKVDKEFKFPSLAGKELRKLNKKD